MSVDAKAEIVIDRPRSTVAKFMFNPKNEKLWIGILTNVFPLSVGDIQPGSKVERVGNFLSRAFSSVFLVTRAEPEKFFEMTADEPFQMKVRYEMEDAENGTKVKIRVQSIGENEYQLPPASFAKAVKDWIEDDLRRLKARIEAL
jgi:hypothetical protein